METRFPHAKEDVSVGASSDGDQETRRRFCRNLSESHSLLANYNASLLPGTDTVADRPVSRCPPALIGARDSSFRTVLLAAASRRPADRARHVRRHPDPHNGRAELRPGCPQISNPDAHNSV
jgi:hypothetical protein